MKNINKTIKTQNTVNECIDYANNQMINEGLIQLLIKFWHWLWSDDDYEKEQNKKKNKGKCPWNFSASPNNPHKPKIKDTTVKKTTKQTLKQTAQKTTTNNTEKTNISQSERSLVIPDVAKLKLKKTTKKVKDAGEVEPITPTQQKEIETKRKTVAPDVETPVVTQPEETNINHTEQTIDIENLPTTKPETNEYQGQPLIGVLPKPKPEHVTQQTITLTDITEDNGDETPESIIQKIFIQSQYNDSTELNVISSFWNIDGGKNTHNIHKKPYYLCYETINQNIDDVPCLVIGVVIYSTDPATYLNLYFDDLDKHSSYVHICRCQVLSQYENTDAYVRAFELLIDRIKAEKKYKGVTIEYFDKIELRRYGFDFVPCEVKKSKSKTYLAEFKF